MLTLFLFLLLNHDIFPFTTLIVLEVKIYFIKTAARVKIDPIVFVVEDTFNREVGSILKGVFPASCRLNEECLLDLSVTLLKQDPAVKSRLSILVFPFKIRSIIINSNSLKSLLFNFIVLDSLHFIVEFRVMRDLLCNLEIFNWHNRWFFLRTHVFFVFVNLGIFLIIVIWHINRKGALHKGFIFGCDFTWSSAIHTISIITTTNKERTKDDSEIKAITGLPIKNVCWRGNEVWEFIWDLKFFIFKEVSNEFCTFIPFIKLCIRKLGWS